MQFGLWARAAATLALTVSVCAARAQPIDEQQLFDELNGARAAPAAYKRGLQQYRGYFHANLLRYPGSVADIATEEGVRVVDETIAYLDRQTPLTQIQFSPVLRAAAEDHIADQSRSGSVGHSGSDGSSPRVRLQRRGGGVYVAEVIAYGPVDAVDAMRQLIVDDGVADRGHRTIIYSPELRYAGAACGPHPVYRTMCVIELALTADGHYPGERVRVASR